ncbi:MAG: thioredoxin family protein [candidate division WOR-3 bacterium]
MMRLSFASIAAVLLLALLPGCPSAPQPANTAAKTDTSLAALGEICETLPAPASTAVAAVPDSVPARTPPAPEPKAEPKPEPKSEPPPKPKALPRMWDYGSDNCQPCIVMDQILTPMMQEYAGKVDIRIINVYRDREKTMQARIQVIPTQIFYDPEGNELFRHIGVYPRDSIVAKFRQFGWE